MLFAQIEQDVRDKEASLGFDIKVLKGEIKEKTHLAQNTFTNLTMGEMSQKFDDLLRFQGNPIFTEYKDYLKQKAHTHAVIELENYRNRLTAENRQQSSPKK
jgi:hypothetical protein